MAFNEQFRHFLVPSKDDIQQAFSSGLVVLDTNVLFSAYRYTSEASEQLLTVIEKMRDRVWIPHQVGLEFYRNRVNVVSDLRNGYSSLLAHVNQTSAKVTKELQERVNELFKRVSLSEEERSLLTSSLNSAFDPLLEAIETLRKKHAQAGSLDDDPILRRIETMLEGRIGAPFGADTEAHMAEAARRIENSVPPGFRDAEKVEPYGDYFVWAQTLSRAKEINARDLLFITGDEKEDWYRQVNRKNVSARPELSAEAREVAGCSLVMMNVGDFLKNARRYLDATVSEETIRQAEIHATEIGTMFHYPSQIQRLDEAEADLGHRLANARARFFEARNRVAVTNRKYADAREREVGLKELMSSGEAHDADMLRHLAHEAEHALDAREIAHAQFRESQVEVNSLELQLDQLRMLATLARSASEATWRDAAAQALFLNGHDDSLTHLEVLRQALANVHRT
ncbi:PIN domain-containing protein [Catellatospora bangladeshensis]|uniref:PIN domain-containing protein n=1 Tax=Catellatospora bangladeshensis TaxID=310355 RepID=UPI0019437701|nr:PIN domain-containing protein [Catellatospora bangladeshensis]